MALISTADLDRVGHVKTAGTILHEQELRAQTHQFSAVYAPKFDVFLSHSYKDASLNKERLINLKVLLKDQYRLDVYIDWIDDEELDRSAVTAATAGRLRDRMRESRCLFFATTQSYSESKWMPWELGYMDGLRSKSAILPVSASGTRDTYQGQEYLGVYPYVDFSGATIYMNFPDGKRRPWQDWVK